MADHVVTLNAKQEEALASILAERLEKNPTLTADQLLKKWVLLPIKERIDKLDAERLAPIMAALPTASNAQIAAVKADLGL